MRYIYMYLIYLYSIFPSLFYFHFYLSILPRRSPVMIILRFPSYQSLNVLAISPEERLHSLRARLHRFDKFQVQRFKGRGKWGRSIEGERTIGRSKSLGEVGRTKMRTFDSFSLEVSHDLYAF